MVLYPKKVQRVTKRRPKPKMKPLNIKKVKKVQKKETGFRNTTLKHCDFYLTYREKYEQEKLAKQKEKEKRKQQIDQEKKRILEWQEKRDKKQMDILQLVSQDDSSLALTAKSKSVKSS